MLVNIVECREDFIDNPESGMYHFCSIFGPEFSHWATWNSETGKCSPTVWPGGKRKSFVTGVMSQRMAPLPSLYSNQTGHSK